MEEDDKDNSQKDDTDDIEDDCPNVKYNKKDLSDIFCCTYENQVSEGGEADLHKHYKRCKKNPGHTQFVPVNDFNINHLPEGHRDNDLVEYIKATVDVTVRLDVRMTSTERPEFWPGTKQPYAFFELRGKTAMRVGTGKVYYAVIQRDGTCPCPKCQLSHTPSKVWGLIGVHTAAHVVFDELEARHTTCRLFYDSQDSPLVTLGGWAVDYVNMREDKCELKCETCDAELLEKLEKMVEHWDDLCEKVNKKYKRSRDKLTLMVSHPHGCSKQISVGHWLDKCEVSDDQGLMTKYTYTTCTCPGSSGAFVHPLGYGDGLSYGLHSHDGVDSQGRNCSGPGVEYNLK